MNNAPGDLFNLPDGFQARPFALADGQAVVDLANAVSQKYTGRPEASLSVFNSFWQNPDFNLQSSTRVITAPNGQIIAYVDIHDTDIVPVRPNAWGRVHPAYEGLGIGQALLSWAEWRARQVLDRLPEDLRVVIDTHTWSTAKPALQLFESLGFKHCRDFWRMTIEFNGPPPEPVWPEGITLSTFAERPDLRAVIEADDDAFRDHWGYVQQPIEDLEKKWQHWIDNEPEITPDGWLLAMAGEEIAGISLCRQREYTDPDMGWVSSLAVRRPYRQKGLGLALLRQSFVMFFQNGRKRAGLAVDANSLTGATRLYEKAGMSVARQDMAFEKELRPGRDLATTSLSETSIYGADVAA